MTRTSIILAAVAALSLTACAEQSAMRLDNNTVRVRTSTAPIYGAVESEKRAMTLAAQETLRAGFDRFIIVSGGSEFRQNTLAVLPGQASGSFNQYGGGFQATGPRPIAMNRFETGLVIKMFHDGEPAGANAISAREILRTEGAR